MAGRARGVRAGGGPELRRPEIVGHGQGLRGDRVLRPVRFVCILPSMAKSEEPEKPGRIKQLRMIAQIIKQSNPKGMPIVFLSAVGTLAVVVVIGLVTDYLWYSIFLGILLAFTVGLVVFGQLAQKAQYKL